MNDTYKMTNSELESRINDMSISVQDRLVTVRILWRRGRLQIRKLEKEITDGVKCDAYDGLERQCGDSEFRKECIRLQDFTKISELKQRIEELEGQCGDLKFRKEHIRLKDINFHKKISELRSELESTIAQRDEYKIQRNELHAKMEELEADLKKAKDWIIELEHPEFGHHPMEIAEIEKDLIDERQACEEHIEIAEQRIAELTEECAKHKAGYDSVRQTLEIVTEERDKLCEARQAFIEAIK